MILGSSQGKPLPLSGPATEYVMKSECLTSRPAYMTSTCQLAARAMSATTVAPSAGESTGSTSGTSTHIRLGRVPRNESVTPGCSDIPRT